MYQVTGFERKCLTNKSRFLPLSRTFMSSNNVLNLVPCARFKLTDNLTFNSTILNGGD